MPIKKFTLHLKNSDTVLQPMKVVILLCIILSACGGSKFKKSPKPKSTEPYPVMIAGQSMDFNQALMESKPITPPCYRQSTFLEGIRPSEFVDQYGLSTDWSDQIAQCVITQHLTSQCELSQLDFLHDISEELTDDHILNRLIVTEQWMADNFRSQLVHLPADLKALFSSVTAIVIHPKIMMGLFIPATGAIYISPDYLPFNKEQFDRLQQLKSNTRHCQYHTSSNVHIISRYVKGGSLVFYDMNPQWLDQYKLFPEHPLGIEHSRLALASLLYHELAHAHDYFPTNILIHRRLDITPDFLKAGSPGAITSQLYSAFPLIDEGGILSALSDSLYKNKNVSSYLPFSVINIKNIFQASGANDIYSFSYKKEDTALLFEEYMMKYHFNLDRELIFFEPSKAKKDLCTIPSLSWKTINRIFDTAVRERAKFITHLISPTLNVSITKPQKPILPTFSHCL